MKITGLTLLVESRDDDLCRGHRIVVESSLDCFCLDHDDKSEEFWEKLGSEECTCRALLRLWRRAPGLLIASMEPEVDVPEISNRTPAYAEERAKWMRLVRERAAARGRPPVVYIPREYLVPDWGKIRAAWAVGVKVPGTRGVVQKKTIVGH